ncbi:negative acting factor [Paramyrothecium foliicola]|nr:negative acting factor [Paramyrothecium foliicola]
MSASLLNIYSYRDLQDLVFRNTGNSGATKRKSLKKQAGKVTSRAPSEHASLPSSSSQVEVITQPFNSSGSLVASNEPSQYALTHGLNEHWTAHSIPIILKLYSSIGFLHEVYRTNYTEGPLLWAAHLFTRTYVTNLQYPTSASRQSREDAQREIGIYLGKTLNSTSAAMKSPGGALRDDVLAAILVGSLTRVDISSPWRLHINGLYSLLKLRGLEQLSSSMGRMIFWPAFNMIQIQAVISNGECPPETEQWLGIIQQTLHDDEYIALHVSVFVHRIAQIQHRVRHILNSRDFDTAGQQFYDITYAISTAIQDLNEAYPQEPAVRVLDHYMHLMRCSVLIKVHGLIQSLVNFLTHDQNCPVPLERLKSQWFSSLHTIRTIARDILEAVPKFTAFLSTSTDMSALFDGLKIIWPLTAVNTTTGTLPEQKEAAANFLVLVGQRSGVRQAFTRHYYGPVFPQQSHEPLGFGCETNE